MTNETKIISLVDEIDYVVVTAEAGGKEQEFIVGLVEGKYKPNLHCTVWTDGADVYEEDFPDFDFDKIIGYAEMESKGNHAELYEYKVIDFGITIGDETLVLRIDKKDGETHILTKILQNFDDNLEYKETGKVFDSEDEAVDFVDSFRSDHYNYSDADGLMKLESAISMHAIEHGID